MKTEFEYEQEIKGLREELARVKEQSRTRLQGLATCGIRRDAAEQRNAELERKHVDNSNYLRECLKRININQNHMFCLALEYYLEKAEQNTTESGETE